MQSPKGRLLKGGLILTLRQLLSTGLSLVSALVVARILGPEQYGIVAIALGIFYFLSPNVKLGLHAYLIRQPDLPNFTKHHILSFYLTVGGALCILLALCAPLMGWWTGQPEITMVVRVLAIPLWFDMIAAVSIAMMEREFNFAEVGIVEAVSQTSNYMVAIPLVLLNWGYWGPIVGLITQFLVLAILAIRYQPIRWQGKWDWTVMKPALAYGIGFSGSEWITTLRSLTIPIFVTRLLGLEAAGIISISIRLIEQLSLLRIVIRRMSISVLAKITNDKEKTLRTISRGIAYQVLLIGVICASFACVASWIIPLVFGDQWLPSTRVFPIIASAALVWAMFDLQTAALYAVGRNRDVALFNGFNVASLWLGCWIFLPMFGPIGYGLAEIFASPSHFLLHRSITKLYSSPKYANALWLAAAAVPPLLGSLWLSPIYSLGILAASYSIVLLFVPHVKEIPLELIAALRVRSA
ncbi:MAG: oligosaccharide flippase family protein [Kaiparowitsia implicata GSE-PSE-MK54-09C]|jgi:PST family polysaccharide transporter|nr:oligosaccharide flippase family protein [Kaiparowitsia implicata GSE-PSE-MK54-09C]